MQPNTSQKTSNESKEREFDTWRVLQKSTDQTRANIIADIVGHPKGAPSVEELDFMNPSLKEDAIRNHLQTLKEVGVIKELVIPPGNRIRGYPYKFYQLTNKARELFDENNLFPRDAWKKQYNKVEKTDDIEEIEAMPRPTPK